MAEQVAARDGCWQRSVSALSHTWLRPDVIDRELEARVGVFEAALEKENFDGEKVHELEREIVQRRDQWSKRWVSVILDHDFAARFNTMSTFGGAESSLATMLWAPIFVVYYGVRRAVGLGTTARLRRALRDGECPDCGYSLVMTKLAFKQTEKLRLIGPRACAECGSVWPCVPPPNAGEPGELPSSKADRR
ncbi:MAG: hypothetical protein ACREJD_03780 [Phycisphaerales bacterium]